MHYNFFRYYDPNCGRFISQDPIGLQGDENFYRFAGNATGFVDVLGLEKCNTSKAVCNALKKLYKYNPNSPYINPKYPGIEPTKETDFLNAAGVPINVGGVDMQYVLTQYRFAEGFTVVGEDFFGLVGISGLSLYSLGGSTVSATNNGVDFDAYINELSEDSAGILLGNCIAVHGDMKSFIEENCND